jgi:hypothetical protein
MLLTFMIYSSENTAGRIALGTSFWDGSKYERGGDPKLSEAKNKQTTISMETTDNPSKTTKKSAVTSNEENIGECVLL